MSAMPFNSTLDATGSGAWSGEDSLLTSSEASVKDATEDSEEMGENDFDSYSEDLRILLVICSLLGVLVLVGNTFLLVISKFASGGKSPTLVFVRSLCVADAVAGVFSVAKGIQASASL